jgi:P27 family predicted phage terminase small subunit
MPPAVVVPDPPAWMGPAGQEQWNKLAPLLIARKLLTDADWTAFALLVRAWDLWCQAQIQINEEGMTSVTEKNNVITHPAVWIANACWSQIIKGCREFGLSPSARTGLTMPDVDQAADSAAQKIVGL